MSCSIRPGSSDYSDARLVTSDGFVIPFHRFIFRFFSDDRQVADHEFELYISTQWRDAQTPIPVLFDAQTVYRVLCFVYDETYEDEDKDLSAFTRAEPPASPPATNTLNTAPQEHQETLLNRGLYELRLTSESGNSGTLLKALDNVKLFQAAYMWKLDRLMVEAAHRFGGFISGAFDQAEFPQITTAIFNSVVDPQCMLYGHVVEECFAHCQSLVNNPKFLTALEYNGKLAVHLYRRLADLRTSLGHGDMAEVPHGSSNSASGNSTSVVDPSTVTDLQNLLDKALAASSTKQEAVDALQREVARLEEALSKVTAADKIKHGHIDALEEAARLKENVSQKTNSVDLEARVQKCVQKFMAEKSAKDAVIDGLDYQLDKQDKKVAELEHALASANERGVELARQINQKRTGQPDKTDFLLERNEALETVKQLQARNTIHEDKIRKLEAQVAAHAQQHITVQTALVPQSPQDAPPRRIDGFGAMTNTVNRINGTSRPPSPLPTPPIPTAPALAAQAPRTGGAATFVEKIVARRAAAGIHGGEPENGSAIEAPPTMPLATRGVFTFAQQPVLSPAPAVSTNGSANTAVSAPIISHTGPHAAVARRPVGPHSPQTNGGAHSSSATSAIVGPHAKGTTQHAPPHINGSAAIPIIDPAAVQPPVSAAPAAAPAAPAVTPAATGHGQGDGGPDPRDSEIQRLLAEVKRLIDHNTFYKKQLSDTRAGPTSNVQTRGSGGHGPSNASSPGGNARLEKVLKALRDYAVDHKSCNDCSINFNAQWRGLVDGTDDRHLILMCSKCGNEKCRFPC
ncbi:hypothetical protein E4T44_03811 [Aureobasidium sp. EXF-8845]|nr:hypothetical protein E4T44_03811 [Aureobasidium sp. EXF-8845]KAI4855214.1 hypothetical protein E4T45_03352 [Aureobasidium sp. EXF-8846]